MNVIVTDDNGAVLDEYRDVSPMAFGECERWLDPYRVEATAAESTHNCLESEWRFLDCDECEECRIRVCVDCGKEVAS